MWYFAWILGLGFAVLLAIVNAIWLEHEQGRLDSYPKKNKTLGQDDPNQP
ncbi:cytochrome bd-I oxidase subunit CydX [Psychrobacter sp. FDAARGOS_221]|nr:cytochrome bd-I oxidase subunit CydX [Psychrobacter sp. FDAARGOS_221]PNK60425.1 cytochrome bd-I oxidase subunit CydX [Psychrobacter sp. FDAARGOS_221]